MLTLRSVVSACLATIVGCGLSLLNPPQAEAASPAQQAVDELESKESAHTDAVQNRFFLKTGRFEITPALGYVPNNPFVKRYVGGVFVGYHISEAFAAEGALLYSPDLGSGDIKGLTGTLVDIAHKGMTENQGSNFQQPIEKMVLGATFAGRWAPVYGKINLIGESVLNFDFYGTAGLGLLSISEYSATYNDKPPAECADGASSIECIIQLEALGNKFKIPVNIGVGFNFFLNQSVALKIDARNYFYVDQKPDYDPEDNAQLGNRLYNAFIASVGVSVFVPNMKPRLYKF